MKKAVLICVSGGSGSGKTTIAERIVQGLPSSLKASILYLDNYYLDQSHIPHEQAMELNYDHPRAFHWERVRSDLKKAIARLPFHCPRYDFVTHKQHNDGTLIPSSDVIIFEGLFANHDAEIMELADLKIYVDTQSDERLLRRMSRDLGERNIDFETTARQWRKHVRPMHRAFIDPQKENADLIIPWYRINETGINAIRSSVLDLINENKD